MGRCSWTIPVIIVLFLTYCRCLEELLESSLPFLILSDTQHASGSTPSIKETLSPYNAPYKAPLSSTISFTSEIIHDKGRTTSTSIPHTIGSNPTELTKDKSSQYKNSISPTFSLTSICGKHETNSDSIIYESDSTFGLWPTFTSFYKEHMAHATRKILESTDELREANLKLFSDRIVDTPPNLESIGIQTQYKELISATTSETSENIEQTITKLAPNKPITTQKLQTAYKPSQLKYFKSNAISTTTQTRYGENTLKLNSTDQNHLMPPDKSSTGFPSSKFQHSETETRTKISAEAWMVNMHNASLQPLITESSTLPILTSSIMKEDMSEQIRVLELSLWSLNYSSISSVYEIISENTKTTASGSLLLMSQNPFSSISSPSSLIQTSPTLSNEMIHKEVRTVNLLSGLSSNSEILHEKLISTTILTSQHLISPSRTQVRETEFSPGVTEHASSTLMPNVPYDIQRQSYDEVQEIKDDPKTSKDKTLTTHKDEKAVLISSIIPQKQFDFDTSSLNSLAHVIEPSFDLNSEILPDFTSAFETKTSYFGMLKKEKVVDFTEQNKSISLAVSSEYVETSETISLKPSIETDFQERNSSVISTPKTNFTENIDNIKASLVTNKSLKANQSNHSSFQEKRSLSKVFITDLPYYTYDNDLNSENPLKSYRSSTSPYSTGLPKFSSIESSFKYESYPISIHPSEEKFYLPSTTSYYGFKPYSQEHSKIKEIQDRIEAQSQTKTLFARKISKFAYTQTTHGLSWSEAENIDVQDIISIPSLIYTDSDHQIASAFNTDSVYEHVNDTSKLSVDLHTTYIEENYATMSSNHLLNDSNSIATVNDHESIEAIVESSEPTFEIFHSLSDKIVLQEIASTSQHEASYLSLFPSRDSSSQSELQSSYTLVQGGSSFWTTNTEPLSTVSDKIDGVLIPLASKTRVKALATVSKQTQNQIKPFISHAFSSLTNQTQTVRSAQSGIPIAWFESNVSFDNSSQHKSLDNDKENQSKSEYNTYLSNENVGTSNFFTSTQFRLEDAITSLIRPTPSTAYDVNTTQPPKLNSNNVVVQVETSDQSNNKILTYKTPTPSSASNSMDYVSTVFSTIVIQGDRKTLTSDNEKKNVVQRSESSGILYSWMENQYEYSSMSQTEISIALAIFSASSNVGIFDSFLSSTEKVQMPNNLDTSYSSPMLNDVQSTFIDHWSIFQTPTSHILKEMVSKQTLQDTRASNSSKGELEFPTPSHSSIIILETTTSNSALLSNMSQISSVVHDTTEDFKNLTLAEASTTKENLINMGSSSTPENSAVSESPRPSLHSSFTLRLSTSMGEQFYSSSRTRQSLHDSKIIVTSAIDIDKHIVEINSFVRSQFTSESESYISSTFTAESSQRFTETNVSVFHKTYENKISSNKIDSSLSQHTKFSSVIDESDVDDVKYFTTPSNFIPETQPIVSSLLSSFEFETTFTPDHVYSSLNLSRTRKFNVETTLPSLDMFSLETEKMSSAVLPVTSIFEQEQRSITSSGYNYLTTNSTEVQQERGISRVDIYNPISVSVAFSGSINKLDTTGSAFSAEKLSPTVQLSTITSSEKTESETHDIESNAIYSKEKENFPSTSLTIKPSLPVFDTSSSSIMVSLFAETNLLVLEINVKLEIDISSDNFQSKLEKDLTTVYIEGLHGRRKRNSIRDSARQVQDTGISVKIREIDRKFGERVKIIFLVMYNGIVVHASLAELTFQKVSDVEMSAILGYPVIVTVSRWNSESTSPPSPGGWEEIFQPLVIVLITLPTSIVIIATIIAIVKQCRTKSMHKHPSIPSQMDSLYKHNLVVDVENGDVRNRRISYEYPSDDEFSMASSDVFNEIKSKYSQSMHSKIKNFEKHNLKNHLHNHVERKASDALTNKVKFSVSAEDSKSACVKTDSNESNDSGVSSDGQKSPGEGPNVPCSIPESVSLITSANMPQNVKQQNNLQIPPRNITLQNPYPVKKKTNIKNLNSERVTSWVFMGDNTDAPNNRVHHKISEGSSILENDTVTQVTHDFNHIPSFCDTECQTSDQASDLGVQDHIYETLNRNNSVKEEKTEQSSMTQTESGTSGSDGFEYLEPLRQLLMAVENHRRRNPPVSQFLQEDNVLQRCIHGFCNMGNCHVDCSPVSIPSRYGEETGECAKKCYCETGNNISISAKQAQKTRASADHVCNERQLVTEPLNPSKELLRPPVVLSETKETCIYDQPEFSLVGFTNSAEI